MKTFGKTVLYGLFLWAVVFFTSFIIFPLKISNPIFFETLISIFLVFFTVFVSLLYFAKTELNTVNAIYAGIIWMAVNIIVDLPLFSYGPMKKTFADYMTDIGLTYLIIPIITIGIALAANQTKKLNE